MSYFIALCLACPPGADADPPLADLERFPGPEIARHEIAMNAAFEDHLRGQLAVALHRTNELGALLRLTERLYRCWDALRDAHCPDYPANYRRECLARLRCLLGEAAYQGGLMPPGAPYWLFPEID